ncbi:hypothetical protein [Paraburkholderia sp. SIMBA_054]|uniref:hypothetical protein n=1 Tax=Paraburkholderia sp. SIMBA_054 TaxID=3085795 RepID=UPI00397839C5
MDVTKIDDDVLGSLRERGHNDEDIAAMTPEAAFSEYCNWRGLSGFGPVLARALDGLRGAAASQGERASAERTNRLLPTRQAQPFLDAIMHGDEPSIAAFAGNVIAVFAAALEETGLPVTRDQILSCIDTQGQSFTLLACSTSVRDRLAEIQSRPKEWYQKMMAEAKVRVSQMDQNNLV